MPITTGSPRAGLPGNEHDPLQDRQARAAGGHRAEVAVGRRLQVDLRRHRPTRRVAYSTNPLADALDRLERVDHGRAPMSWSNTGISGIGDDDTLRHPHEHATASSTPAGPRIEIRQAAASPEEAAAIAAAIEQFLRDTAPRARTAGERPESRGFAPGCTRTRDSTPRAQRSRGERASAGSSDRRHCRKVQGCTSGVFLDVRRGDPADAPPMTKTFVYEHTDIPPGLTLAEWRQSRPRPERRTWLTPIRSLTAPPAGPRAPLAFEIASPVPCPDTWLAELVRGDAPAPTFLHPQSE